MLADTIGPRYPAAPATMEVAAAYITRQLRNGGDAVATRAYRVDGAEVANLIVERPGVQRPNEIVLLGAHYDTVPTTPGADDNASAVAVLLEAARLLAATRTRRTLRFVAFPCEEPPYSFTDAMGSERYARECRLRGERIIGMLCLEMVGYYRDEPYSQQLPPSIPRFLRPAFPRRGNFLAAVGNLRSLRLLFGFRRGFKRNSRLPLFTIALPERVSEIRRSDNASFWDQGFPALMITDTSFLRNPHYHRPSDRPATLDYDRLAAATLGVASALAWLGQRAG